MNSGYCILLWVFIFLLNINPASLEKNTTLHIFFSSTTETVIAYFSTIFHLILLHSITGM